MRAQRKNVRELTEARCPNEQRAGERQGYGGEFRIIGADGHRVDYIILCDSDRGRVAKFDKQYWLVGVGPARGPWTNLGRLPLRVFSIGKYAFQKKVLACLLAAMLGPDTFCCFSWLLVHGKSWTVQVFSGKSALRHCDCAHHGCMVRCPPDLRCVKT
jgi:hypothetical protein